VFEITILNHDHEPFLKQILQPGSFSFVNVYLLMNNKNAGQVLSGIRMDV
jgi:hypothetical protein